MAQSEVAAWAHLCIEGVNNVFSSTFGTSGQIFIMLDELDGAILSFLCCFFSI